MLTLAAAVVAAIVAGCATPQIDWGARIGHYTFDRAVLELGPPDKSAQLADGTVVAEWLMRRGYARSAPMFGGPAYGFYPYHYHSFYMHHDLPPSPDRFLRLTFDTENRLIDWKRIYK